MATKSRKKIDKVNPSSVGYKISHDGNVFTITLDFGGIEVKLGFSETIRARDKLNEILMEIQRRIAYEDLNGDLINNK